MRVIKIVLLLQLLIVGCTEKNDDESYNSNIKYFTWEDFGKTDTLKLEPRNKFKLKYCYKMYKKDSLLFFIDSNTKKYFVTITDLDGNLKHKCIKEGNASSEVMYAFYLGFIDNKYMYIYDGHMEKVLFYFNLNDVLSQKTPKIIKTSELGISFSRVKTIISENKFIIVNDTNLSKFEISDSNFIVKKKIGNYGIKSMNNKNAYYIKGAYKNKIAVEPKKSRFVFTYDLIDLIEIYDTTGKIVTARRGPDNFELYNFNPHKINFLAESYSAKINKSKFAYIGAKATEKYIFGLYDGNIISKERGYCSNKILVYDWDGNPVKYFYLSEPISAFDIEEKTNTLYGYDTDNGILYKAKLDF